MKKIIPLFLLFSASVSAQSLMILNAHANLKTNQLYDIEVTIRHPDTGWDHYANEWIVVADDGKEIAKRTLYHPHVDEQPFTRYARDVVITADANKITITAKCNKGHESKPFVLMDKNNMQ